MKLHQNMIKPSPISVFLQKVLPEVEKPARYIGGEVNSITKSFNQTKLQWAIGYPDLYEIGMSNMAIQLIYHILNQNRDILCERFFAPAVDMENKLKQYEIPYFSLESKTPLKNFDIIGFSLGFELTYTNILQILSLSQLPIKSSQRNENHPIIIAGGPCSFNPEPLAEFFDLFFIGEAEDSLMELSHLLMQYKDKKYTRDEFFKLSQDIKGIYVPSLTYPIYNDQGKMIDFVGKKVQRAIIYDFKNTIAATKPIIPSIRTIQDRGQLEIMRGCAWGCRFCQAGYIYRPARERDVNTILDLTETIYQNTGYREFSLSSLSTADYSNLLPLVELLNNKFGSFGVSFSLPSLRIDSFTLEMAASIKEIRKSGLTLAIESANTHQQKIMNKEQDIPRLIQLIDRISKLGWKKLKLYFMLGLPSGDFEVNEAQNIIELIHTFLKHIKRMEIIVHLGIFVPKPFTPFQWEKQLSASKGLDLIKTIKFALPKHRVKIRYQNPQMSEIEGVLARGDRKISQILEQVFHQGARFDAWEEHFDYERWIKTMEEKQVSFSQLSNKKSIDSILPWDFISTGITKSYFKKDYKRALKEESQPDCWVECFENCGVCSTSYLKQKQYVEEDGVDQNSSLLKKTLENYKFMERQSQEAISTLQIRFKKTGLSRFISHIDLVNHFDRALTRAGLPIVFSQGFNPIPKLEFASALSTGIASVDEVLEIPLFENLSMEHLSSTTLSDYLPQGIDVLETRILPLNKSLGKRVVGFVYSLDTSKLQEKYRQIIHSLSQEAIIQLKTITTIKGKVRNNPLHHFQYYKEEQTLEIHIIWDPNEPVNIYDLLAFIFNETKDVLRTWNITRNKILIEAGEQ